MSIVRQVIGWGEGCYWDLRLKAGFEMLCCTRVSGFVRCRYGSGGFQAAFLFEVSPAALRGLLRPCRVLPQLEHEVTHGAKGRRDGASSRVQPCSKALAQGFPSITSPPGPQRAIVPARQGGAGCCRYLRPQFCKVFPFTGVPGSWGAAPHAPAAIPWLQGLAWSKV